MAAKPEPVIEVKKETPIEVKQGLPESRLAEPALSPEEEERRIFLEKIQVLTETSEEEARKITENILATGGIDLGSQDVLSAPERPGFVRRFVNDKNEGRRIQQMLAQGWSIVDEKNLDIFSKVVVGVEGKTGSQVGSQIRRNGGNGVNIVLMETPKQLNDMKKNAEQNKVLDPLDEQQRLIQEDQNYDGQDGFYIPEGRSKGFAVHRPN